MIHIEQKFEVRAPRQTVWDFLSDISRAAACVPGVEKVEPLADDKYHLRQSMKIGPIKATFDGQVVFVEKRPPELMRLQMEGKDTITGSKIRVSAADEVLDAGAGVVMVVVNGDVDVLGALGKYGQGVADKKAAEVAGEFSAAMRAQVEQPMQAA
ncbi:MAG: SRPBCC domain-containing protein [Chloroflexota bacterium]